jgi:hypothetical protein
VHVEIVVLGREIDELPGFVHRRLPGPERQADRGHRRIELADFDAGARHDVAVLVNLLVAEPE